MMAPIAMPIETANNITTQIVQLFTLGTDNTYFPVNMPLIQEVKQLSGKSLAKMGTAIGTAIVAGVVGGFMAGNDEPALTLDSPFSMRMVMNSNTNDFERLILTEDESLGKAEKGRRFLRLRQVRSSFDIVPMGLVTAQDFRRSTKDRIKDGLSVIPSADAAEVFTWNGHENDGKFKEAWDTKLNAMHRWYSDGCELAYNLDPQGKSIPASFRWLKKTH